MSFDVPPLNYFFTPATSTFVAVVSCLGALVVCTSSKDTPRSRVTVHFRDIKIFFIQFLSQKQTKETLNDNMDNITIITS